MGQSTGKEGEESPDAGFRLVGLNSGRRAGDGRGWWPLTSGLEGAGKAAPALSQTLGAHSLELRNQGGQVLRPSCLNNKHRRLAGGTALENRFSHGEEFTVGDRGGILLRRMLCGGPHSV